VAYGHVGELTIQESGDVIVLHGREDRQAQVRDLQGMRLYAPRITVLQSTGIVTADGPGKVYVTSTAPLGQVGVRVGGPAPTEVNYLVLYDGEVKYNSLARMIKFRENVELRQENVQGRADVLVLNLEEAPGAASGPQPETGLQVKSAEAEGRVRFKRFEPAQFNSDKNIPLLDRPGKTVYTKSAQAFYDITEQTVKLFGGPPDPEAVQQTNAVDEMGQLRRSRVKSTAKESIVLYVQTGDIKCYPRAHIEYLRNTGPMDFGDD